MPMPGCYKSCLTTGSSNYDSRHFFGDAADFFVEKACHIVMISYQVQRA